MSRPRIVSPSTYLAKNQGGSPHGLADFFAARKAQVRRGGPQSDTSATAGRRLRRCRRWLHWPLSSPGGSGDGRRRAVRGRGVRAGAFCERAAWLFPLPSHLHQLPRDLPHRVLPRDAQFALSSSYLGEQPPYNRLDPRPAGGERLGRSASPHTVGLVDSWGEA
jgi:hypothetical protein